MCNNKLYFNPVRGKGALRCTTVCLWAQNFTQRFHDTVNACLRYVDGLYFLFSKNGTSFLVFSIWDWKSLLITTPTYSVQNRAFKWSRLKCIKCECRNDIVSRDYKNNIEQKKFLKRISQQCNDLRNEVPNKGSQSARLKRKASHGSSGKGQTLQTWDILPRAGPSLTQEHRED